MKASQVNALSTSVIAFATILGLIGAIYYYLQSLRTKILYIWVIEILISVMIISFMIVAKRGMENEI